MSAQRVSLQCQVTAKYVQETSPGSLAHGVPMPRSGLLAGLARTMVAVWLMEIERIFSISP